MASNSPRKSTALVLLQPLGSAVSTVFAFGVLVVATRQGQFLSIASFGAGAGVAALASVAVGGGTTLAYTTGLVARQRAVRVVRSTIVLPTIAIATGVAVILYSAVGQLDPLSVLAGGASTASSVGAELDASYLRRHLMTGRSFVADSMNRMIAFVLIVLGAPFAFAMLAGAIWRALLLRIFTKSDPSRERGFRISREVLALAYEARLTSLSVLYAICDRAGALVAPLAAPTPVAGGFAAVLSAQQNVSGVLVSSLQTTLAARSEQRSQLAWANRLDMLFVVAGVAAAGVMIAWQGPLVRFLGLDAVSEPWAYWVAVALLVPASLASRLFEFRFLTTSASHNAVISRAAATVVAGIGAMVAFTAQHIVFLAAGLLVAELVSIVTSLGLLGLKWMRSRRGEGHG